MGVLGRARTLERASGSRIPPELREVRRRLGGGRGRRRRSCVRPRRGAKRARRKETHHGPFAVGVAHGVSRAAVGDQGGGGGRTAGRASCDEESGPLGDLAAGEDDVGSLGSRDVSGPDSRRPSAQTRGGAGGVSAREKRRTAGSGWPLPREGRRRRGDVSGNGGGSRLGSSCCWCGAGGRATTKGRGGSAGLVAVDVEEVVSEAKALDDGQPSKALGSDQPAQRRGAAGRRPQQGASGSPSSLQDERAGRQPPEGPRRQPPRLARSPRLRQSTSSTLHRPILSASDRSLIDAAQGRRPHPVSWSARQPSSVRQQASPRRAGGLDSLPSSRQPNLPALSSSQALFPLSRGGALRARDTE